MANPNTVFWEAVLDDGTVQREASGMKYGQITRNRLKTFRLVSAGTIIAEVFAGQGKKGSVLCYRRRTFMQDGKRKVYFLIGFVPLGPVYAVDVQEERVLSFNEWGIDGFWMPQPIPEEGEVFITPSKGHTLDSFVR